MAFTATDEGGENGDLFVLVFFVDIIDDLFLAELDHFLTGIVRMGFADTGVEEAEEVIDLRHGSDRTAGVLVRRLLFDGNNGAKAGDLVHVRSFHIADELPGVGAEAFHIASLPFGVDGVESQRRFTAAADTGDHDQLIFGDADVDVLQIVHPCSGYINSLLAGQQARIHASVRNCHNFSMILKPVAHYEGLR